MSKTQIAKSTQKEKWITPPATIDELVGRLLESYADMTNGVITTIESKERANLAGKVMNAYKLKIKQAEMLKYRINIPFLNVREHVELEASNGVPA